MASFYRAHGEFCANHPWEVIVATLTLTACILSIDTGGIYSLTPASHSIYTCPVPPCQEYSAVDVIVMASIRCMAVLYSYYQFRNLHKLGSKYILGIAALFTVFSSFVFSSGVINCLHGNISDLEDALFFFLLLIDLSRATILAQFALSASTQDEVKKNIARGFELLGPTLTLDTVVETLAISVGTLSGIRRLELLCSFACMSVVVNYLVFMTFYPACLSLILELSKSKEPGKKPSWHYNSEVHDIKDGEQKPNPVLQRVKIIMSAGLVVVHLHSRWTIKGLEGQEHNVLPLVSSEHTVPSNSTDNEEIRGYLYRWITVSADHVVILILLLALTVKFVFFEDKEEIIAGDVITSKGIGIKPFIGEEINTKNFHTQRESKLIQTEEMFAMELHALESTAVNTAITNVHDSKLIRPLEDCLSIYKKDGMAENLSDLEVELLVEKGHIPTYSLEKAVNNPERGVKIRRKIVGSVGGFPEAISSLPYKNYDYSKVLGACCENVVGYMPIPVGMAGPLLLDGQLFHVPMATTEGCLVASTNRGCRALMNCGVTSRVVADGMTRGPVVRFKSITRASEVMEWLQVPENFIKIKESFDSTSRFARLSKLHMRIAGRYLFIRFVATTGDAMGMNMASKGTEVALNYIQTLFEDMEILSLSGNFCADKKPAAVNWIEGRGKSVVCQATVPSNVVKKILKTSVQALVDVNISKNLVGSAVAGSIGGFNAHAANIVTAIFIATGQDPAQNVSSSNCMTLMEPWGDEGQDLHVSCTMPSIEIGTVGGGTQLPAQAACLDFLGVRGAHDTCPGQNANMLARIVCASVLAGELSLLSALASGHLVKSHLRHNRSSAAVNDLTQQNKVPPFVGSSK
ncbi:3-hydroxy-3-methylglutaryl-coenzyme A reductase-like [Cimex lectularius]|uniref:3-hydroxy-3-methylglutaryl coenzyme A reductase n=1 Tax=Cimex lectularius TaxID=79782 RepID=A0A8I6ST22_CIMLE|nr:3-hydroxy-3-methylglutaryl-coenzyme A reductase-like [Cimex lectularius]XP_024085535.1 3-hydroxy-3-methylglutaryl-coenzyme A reductase-like [Cimex lectularius]